MENNIEKIERKVLLAAHCDPELVEKLDELANRTNRSRSKMIITILEDFFANIENDKAQS